MLRRLIRDDMRGASVYYFPMAVMLFIIGGIASYFCGSMYSNSSESAVRAVAVLEPIQYYCRQLLLVTALPAVLLRVRDTIAGSGGYFWMMIPARPWKHIVSKLICSVMLFLCSVVMYAALRLIFIRSEKSGTYAKMYFYGMSSNINGFWNSMIFGGVTLLFVLLCLLGIIEGAVLFASPCRSKGAVTMVISTVVSLLTAGSYAAGHVLVGKLSFIAVSENAKQLLGYSYSCAFFAVMTIVYTIIDIQLMGRRAEI